MKKIGSKYLLIIALFILSTNLLAGEKAEIRYKNGDVIKCLVEKYEIGKYAIVFDENNKKRLISWDSIAEIVFESNAEASIKIPEPEVVIPEEVPVEVIPEVVEQKEPEKKAESSSGKSMLEQFKAKETKTEETSQQKPKNAAERWAEKQKQDKIEAEKEEHKQDIRQENEYQKPEVDLNKDSGKLSVEYYKTLESDSERRSWIENGGILKAKGYTANYSYTSMEMENYDGSKTDFSMHGLGMAFTGALRFIKPPSYEEGKNNWGAFTLGGGLSYSITFGGMEMDMIGFDWNTMTQYTYTAEMNMTSFTMDLSGNIGYTFGLGKYFTPEDWKGVMLGLYWKPNFVISNSSTEIDGVYYEGDPTTAFNFMGFQWSIDWGSFGAMADKLAEEAHFTINGFILPESDTTPFMFSVGLGLVWY
jgi:hypothetical protein